MREREDFAGQFQPAILLRMDGKPLAFSEFLNTAMQQTGASPKEMSIDCRVSESTISRWRTGEQEPEWWQVYKRMPVGIRRSLIISQCAEHDLLLIPPELEALAADLVMAIGRRIALKAKLPEGRRRIA